MGRKKVSITETEKMLAIAERETISAWAIVQRLSAVIAYASHKAEDVAQIFDVSTETIIRWAAKFKKQGVDGLRDKAKGHRLQKLTGTNAETVRKWILTRKDASGHSVKWTLKRLCIEIKKQFDIDIGHSAMAETLAKMNLTVKRPRPMHYKYSPEKAEEFKKKPLK